MVLVVGSETRICLLCQEATELLNHYLIPQEKAHGAGVQLLSRGVRSGEKRVLLVTLL